MNLGLQLFHAGGELLDAWYAVDDTFTRYWDRTKRDGRTAEHYKAYIVTAGVGIGVTLDHAFLDRVTTSTEAFGA